ncbi:hypothetical protein EKO04_004551 [Ascochyta lentis]|uniref:Uncharacterized protein n=1 Tax=Ascochyta lentis TaxID=205686 RepID=A0A8H7MKI3_9PLEO|nr:hypothetical protein EKO04_004551 [Ascochyta lentis]
MSTFDNFDRLAMSETQFLRMAEAELQQAQRPQARRSPSFAEKFLWKSPSLGTTSLRRDTASPGTSPALSTTSSFSSPKMSASTETYYGPSSVNSPSMGSGWGLGLVFRKRSNTNASNASSPSIGGRTPTLGGESPKLGSSNVDAHKRSGSGSSEGCGKDEFGLVREKHVSQLF